MATTLEAQTNKNAETPVENCATRPGRAPVVQPAVAADDATRKLSRRDAALVVSHLAKPRKPGAALKAAARKYWSHR